MLYEVNWTQAEYNRAKLAEAVQASDNDQFIFIVTCRQRASFLSWVQYNELEKFLLFQSPTLTNKVHEGSGRNLIIYVYGTGDVKEQVYRAPKKQLKLFN